MELSRCSPNLFPPISRPKRPPSTRTSGDESTGQTWLLAYHPPSPGDLHGLVREFDGTKSEFRAFTAALLLHCGTAAWVLETASSHFATLSTSKQAEVTESQEDFLAAYGRIGTTNAHAHIAGLLTMIFKPYAHTAHLVRAEVVYALGKGAATTLWGSIRATYADKTDFVCNKTMELFHLIQQFDGSHYKTLETDIISCLSRFQMRTLVSTISRPCVF